MLIVFEGPEGAGKSTQAARLAAHLKAAGTDHLLVREPGGTDLGERLRGILLDPTNEITAEAECLLFLAARAEIVPRVVRPALDSGKVVLLDRFFLSTYAYQVSGRGLDAGEVGSANRVATGGLVPGITLLLSVSPGQGMARARQRGVPDRMELTGSAFHDRVASAFRRFGEASWQREHPECGEIVTIDASRTTDEVFDSVLEVLASRGLLAAL